MAFLLHIAAESTGHYRGPLAALDDATGSVTRAALDAAHARVDRRERPELRAATRSGAAGALDAAGRERIMAGGGKGANRGG